MLCATGSDADNSTATAWPTQARSVEATFDTPTQYAIRYPADGAIWVTNDYKLIDADTGIAGSELQATSCGRFDRICQLLKQRRPTCLEGALDYLGDPAVQMLITVQQMAFASRSGAYAIRVP